MRKLSPLAIITLLCIYAQTMQGQTTEKTDSGKAIIHLLDGNLNEWPQEKFETDKDTKIMFAEDNDPSNLYLAMKIPSQGMQMKMIMQGMKLFIDKKGKKREGMGIEFPIKREGGMGFRGAGGGRPGEGSGEGQQRPDPKEMRDNLTAMMIFLKTFGIDNQEDRSQIINAENEVNISFNWDESNALLIEYSIPMRIIGETGSLAGKPMGIGWKIAGTESTGGGGGFNSFPSANSGRSAGGRTGGGAGNLNRDMFAASNRGSEQNIWTKYIVHN